MTDAVTSKAKPNKEWFDKFWAEEQERADVAGMNIIEYQMQANGGTLKPTVLKLLRHVKAHPKTCPQDCVFQISMNRLKEQHSRVEHKDPRA